MSGSLLRFFVFFFLPFPLRFVPTSRRKLGSASATRVRPRWAQLSSEAKRAGEAMAIASRLRVNWDWESWAQILEADELKTGDVQALAGHVPLLE